MLRRCLQEMQQIGANLVGVVMNGIRSTRGGYMRRNLQLYYAGDYASTNGNGKEKMLEQTEEEEEADAPMVMLVDESEDGKSMGEDV